MPSETALRDCQVALTRFGLGPRPSECAAIANDPRGFVLAQLDRPQTALIAAPGLLPTPENMALNLKDRRERRAARKLENEQIEAAKAAAKASGGRAGDMAGGMAGDMAGGMMADGMAGDLAAVDDGTVKRDDSQKMLLIEVTLFMSLTEDS